MFEKITGWFKGSRFIDFSWLKKTKFVELENIDVSEDPVRPELDLEWRRSFGRKIFGLDFDGTIQAIMCIAFTNDVPTFSQRA